MSPRRGAFHDSTFSIFVHNKSHYDNGNKKNDNSSDGKAIVKNFGRIDDKTGEQITTEIPLSPSISHNFIIGVDEEDGVLWVATSKGVSRGELIK